MPDFELFKDLVCVREDAPKRIGATTDSIALIANNGGKGVILEYNGAGIEASVEAIGVRYLDDHGLDDAPDGLSIWEGRYLVTRSGNFEHPDEYDAELDGTFRDLTDREWALLRETGTPWEYLSSVPSSNATKEKSE